MRLSLRGIKQIKSDEALRLFAYLDDAGVPTIGWGHTRGAWIGQHISEAQAEAFLSEDISIVEECVNAAVKVPLTQTQFDALCGFTFNLGCGSLRDSTLLKKLNAGDYAGAADEILRWDKVKQHGTYVKSAGLAARRERERSLFLEDGTAHAPQEPHHEFQAAPSPAPPKETTVVAPVAAVAGSFLWELAKTAINLFTPLAQEKLTKELDRHVNNPAVSAQVATAIIDTAKAATGKSDPMEAVVEARKDPAIIQKMESSALDEIDRLMPVLEKLQKWETDAWAAEEASRDAASARARGEEKDQDAFLTRAIIGMVIGLMATLGGLIGILTWLKADSGTIGTLVGLFAAGGGAIVGSMTTRIQHRYGSSRGSAAAGATLQEIARRPKAA